jgi:hypothetical protein
MRKISRSLLTRVSPYQFDAFADVVSVTDELGDGRGGHDRSFQVAVEPKPATFPSRTAAASSGPRAIASAILTWQGVTAAAREAVGTAAAADLRVIFSKTRRHDARCSRLAIMQLIDLERCCVAHLA